MDGPEGCNWPHSGLTNWTHDRRSPDPAARRGLAGGSARGHAGRDRPRSSSRTGTTSWIRGGCSGSREPGYPPSWRRCGQRNERLRHGARVRPGAPHRGGRTAVTAGSVRNRSGRAMTTSFGKRTPPGTGRGASERTEEIRGHRRRRPRRPTRPTAARPAAPGSGTPDEVAAEKLTYESKPSLIPGP